MTATLSDMGPRVVRKVITERRKCQRCKKFAIVVLYRTDLSTGKRRQLPAENGKWMNVPGLVGWHCNQCIAEIQEIEQREEKQRAAVKKILEQYGVRCLYYMAPLDNIPSILDSGILPYNRALRLTHRDVSLWAVQKRREAIIPISGKRIHDYVPLYFAVHTPMQYRLTRGAKGQGPLMTQNKLAFLEVDAYEIFSLPGVLFTDGNAAATETRFFTDIDHLGYLDWYIIRCNDCWSSEYRRKKAAEVLVPDCIPIQCFRRVVVYDEEIAQFLNVNVAEVARSLQIPIDVDRAFYYQLPG